MTMQELLFLYLIVASIVCVAAVIYLIIHIVTKPHVRVKRRRAKAVAPIRVEPAHSIPSATTPKPQPRVASPKPPVMEQKRYGLTINVYNHKH